MTQILNFAIGALIATHLAMAVVIPRQPAITVTATVTRTLLPPSMVTSTTSIPYTSTFFSYDPVSSVVVAPGINPINGLPAVGSTTQQSPGMLTPVPYGSYTPSGWTGWPKSATHSSSLTPVPYGTYTPSSWVNTTSTKQQGPITLTHTKPAAVTAPFFPLLSGAANLAPSFNTTTRKHTVTSAGNGQGLIGNGESPKTSTRTRTSETKSVPTTTQEGYWEGMIGAKPSR